MRRCSSACRSSTRRTSRRWCGRRRRRSPRSYLDQLNRTQGISPQRAKTITDVLSKADQLRTGKEGSAAGTLTALDAVAAQVEGDAKAATGLDQKRLTALADTLRRRAASLR